VPSIFSEVGAPGKVRLRKIPRAKSKARKRGPDGANPFTAFTSEGQKPSPTQIVAGFFISGLPGLGGLALYDWNPGSRPGKIQ